MVSYKAVCFDFDYTLGDCTKSILEGFHYALPAMGWPDPSDDAIRGTIGYLLEDAYTLLTGDSDPDHRARFRPLYAGVATRNQIEEARLFPGAQNLVLTLNRAGIHTAIVSTRMAATTRSILARFGLDQSFSVILGSSDVRKPKPDPQGLLAAMERLGVTARETLFCGDTVLDAGAAQNAGCDFAAVLNGTTEAKAFRPFRPVFTAPDLPSLQRWLSL